MRRACGRLPGSVEVEAWGHPTFRVGGRIFAAVERYRGRPCIAIGAERDEQDFLVRHFGFFESPYVGKRGWVSVWVDEPAPVRIITDLLKRAHRRLAPGSEGAALPRRGSRRPPRRKARTR